jgi:hypothetical protein
MDLSSPVVDNQYFKVLIVPQAVIAEVLRDLFAMFDRFSIRIELKADAVSHRDAVFHIEKKLSHGQSSIKQSRNSVLYGAADCDRLDANARNNPITIRVFTPARVTLRQTFGRQALS